MQPRTGAESQSHTVWIRLLKTGLREVEKPIEGGKKEKPEWKIVDHRGPGNRDPWGFLWSKFRRLKDQDIIFQVKIIRLQSTRKQRVITELLLNSSPCLWLSGFKTSWMNSAQRCCLLGYFWPGGLVWDALINLHKANALKRGVTT